MATWRTHASGTSGNGPHPEFDGIGEIKLKGFSVSTEMFVARPADEEE